MNGLFTLGDHFLQGRFVLGVAVRAGLREVIERITNLMVGVDLAFRVLHFRHVAVDTGHVVLAVNACAPGFILRVLRFQHRGFRQGVGPVREGDGVVVFLHVLDFHAVVPRELNGFVFTVEVVFHVTLAADHGLLVKATGFLKRFADGFHRTFCIRTRQSQFWLAFGEVW